MKRIICIIFALLFVSALCACNEETVQESETAESSEVIIEELPYYFFAFNSRQLTGKDKETIESIKGLYEGAEIVDFDVRDIKNATEIYTLLKAEHEKRGGELKGIQIFGDSKAVPSFELGYKVALGSGIKEGDSFISDYFFTNFNNEISVLESFNVYDCFEKEANVDFQPQWCVARLPVTRGKFSSYYKNYCEYKELTQNQDILTVAVSSPIFRTGWFPVSYDDMGYFIQRARDEWGFIDEMKLYANTEGFYPSVLEVDGNFKAEEWTKESEERVCEYYISGHAGEIAILQTVYTSESEFECQRMISFNDINTYLNEKPYFINTVGCSTAKNMRENIIQNSLHGKCIGAFAATSEIANTDIDCMASKDRMENGYTYYTLFYGYMKARAQDASRAQAFLAGQQAMATALENTRQYLEDYQYQNNYHNLLSLQNFGIID